MSDKVRDAIEAREDAKRPPIYIPPPEPPKAHKAKAEPAPEPESEAEPWRS